MSLQSVFKASKCVDLLLEFGSLRFNFSLQSGLSGVDQTCIFNFSFEHFDLRLLHLHVLFVVLHLLGRVADFDLDQIEFSHDLLDLLSETFTDGHLVVVLLLLELSVVQLLLQLAVNLRLELGF